MNREILFRGMDENGNWHYGDLIQVFDDIEDDIHVKTNKIDCVIRSKEKNATYIADIVPETVGQYTGLKDCEGEKIFEGDFVEDEHRAKYEVLFDECGYIAKLIDFKDPSCDWVYLDEKRFLIKGNIHEK